MDNFFVHAEIYKEIHILIKIIRFILFKFVI